MNADEPTHQLALWVVYDHPRDYPDGFVARRWILNKPTGTAFVGPTLDSVRAQLPAGLTCLHRSPSDERHIVETWL